MKNTLFYNGQTGQLFRIYLKTIGLMIVTCGLYRFWGRTNARRYIVGSFGFGNAPFVYTGTGRELLFALARAIVFLGGAFLVHTALSAVLSEDMVDHIEIIAFVPIVFLIHLAFVSAVRYRLSRVQYKGSAFYLTGSAKALAILMFRTFLLNILTLGFLAYKTVPQRYKAFVGNIVYGSTAFSCDVDPKKLFKINWITMVLFPVTLGFSRAWFNAMTYQEVINSMRFGSLTFRTDIKGVDLFKLNIVNWGILIGTLGFGLALTQHRTYTFFADRIQIFGQISGSNVIIPDSAIDLNGEGFIDVLGNFITFDL